MVAGKMVGIEVLNCTGGAEGGVDCLFDVGSKGQDIEVQFGVEVADQDESCVQKGIAAALKAFTDVLKTVSPRKITESKKARKMSRCKVADYRSMLPCAPRTISKNFLSTMFPVM
jgi:hypothetical protein